MAVVVDAPDAATISLHQVLALLDGNFNAFANGVADGRYAFWLGSGISLARFPGLKALVAKVLEYLRTRADPNDASCPFRAAIERAVRIAPLTAEESAQIDLAKSASDWPVIGVLRDRLAANYSAFLNIDIDGEEPDVLVWEGVGVADTYADPNVDPDAEHLAIAVLIKEGLVEELASANWDGLIEKAVEQISGGECALDVCVKSEDLQGGDHRSKLLKFHGCAVRARENEAEYRPYIVGRQAQVDAWRDDPKMKGLLQHLLTILIERPTLMLGLSAQDFNVRSLFGQASNALKWEWPGDRPAYVFSEDEISEGQLTLLQNVYREHYAGAQRENVKKSAHLRAFAKPLLLALILYSYAAKLARLAHIADVAQPPELAEWFDSGIKRLRDDIADSDKGDHLAFLQSMITFVSRTKSLLLAGVVPRDPHRYEPLTSDPVSQIVDTLELRGSGLCEAAVAAAILGAGVVAGEWRLELPNAEDPKSGIALLTTPESQSRLFVVASVHAELALFSSGRIDENEDAILIHAQPHYERMQRSPKRSPGRTGAQHPRRISIKSLLADTDGPEALMRQFKMEVAV